MSEQQERLIAEMAIENAELREQVKAKDAELERVSRENFSLKNLLDRAHARLDDLKLGTLASPAGEAVPDWGSAKTAGNLIAQLRTLDPATPIYAALRLSDGRVKLKPLDMSWEWKSEQFLLKGPDAERVAVLWTRPDEREAQPAPATEPPLRWPGCIYTHTASGTGGFVLTVAFRSLAELHDAHRFIVHHDQLVKAPVAQSEPVLTHCGQSLSVAGNMELGYRVSCPVCKDTATGNTLSEATENFQRTFAQSQEGE